MTELTETLKRCSLFSGLSDDALMRLLGSSHQASYLKNSCVFDIGDQSEEIYVLLEGRVCFDIYTEDGKKFTLGIAEPPWVIGDMELFFPTPRRSRATVLEDVVTLEIPKSVFFEVCRADPTVYEKLLSIYASRLQDAGISLRTREDDKLLSRYLLHSAERFGSQINGNAAIDISQDALASLIGIPRQRINRILNKWKELGWIEIQYGNIVILDQLALNEVQK